MNFRQWRVLTLLLNLLYFLELVTKAKHKNGQGLLTPFMSGSAGGNQNFHFSVSDDVLYHIRWKVLVSEVPRICIRRNLNRIRWNCFVSGVKNIAFVKIFGDRNNVDCIRWRNLTILVKDFYRFSLAPVVLMIINFRIRYPLLYPVPKIISGNF